MSKYLNDQEAARDAAQMERCSILDCSGDEPSSAQIGDYYINRMMERAEHLRQLEKDNRIDFPEDYK